MNDDNDPLGYDTADPSYMRKMARDALTGRNQDAVDAEAAALAQLFGRTPRLRTRRQRLRRWLKQRWWRVKFMINDMRR